MEKKWIMSKFCFVEIKIFRMSNMVVFDFRFICVLFFCLGDCIVFGIFSILGIIIIINIYIYMWILWKKCEIVSIV